MTYNLIELKTRLKKKDYFFIISIQLFFIKNSPQPPLSSILILLLYKHSNMEYYKHKIMQRAGYRNVKKASRCDKKILK